MKTIARRLDDPKEGLSDATIGAVAILTSSDHHFEWPTSVQETHSLGLAELIARRGGWADLLHSAMYGTRLRVKAPSRLIERPSQDIGDMAGKEFIQHAPGILLGRLPFNIANILCQLRILSRIKALLLSERKVELCQTFSDLLWKLEYAILNHRDAPDTSAEYHTSPFGSKLMIDSVGIAALLFSYFHLRDLAAPILYDKLSARLRSTLSALPEPHVSSGAGVESLAQIYAHKFLGGDELSILLWLLNLGLQGSRSDQQGKEWFSTTMAQICWNNGILSRALVNERIRNVVPQATQGWDVSEEAWTRVQALIDTYLKTLKGCDRFWRKFSTWPPGTGKGEKS
ncbi:hypothetical protein LTR20_008196 [Exophiala xenobiotica]|nr:hypothetical protein LTR20_008196 [Exophiala xenobiotica]KAK5491107.1 hypothetical protein LTR26_003869 [Exophiala xenobiotica]KAK5493545.1 hypothetical protein LTR83_005947 [Exophiala xenobiotica]